MQGAAGVRLAIFYFLIQEPDLLKFPTPLCLLTVFLLGLLTCNCLPAQASHIQGGELTYTLDAANPLRIRVQLTTFTDYTQTSFDSPTATIFFGPGQGVTVNRSSRTTFPEGYNKNIYVADYVFPAAGTYTLSYSEQNRQTGLINIADSQEQAFCILTQVVVDPLGLSNLQSAQFLTIPIHSIMAGETVKHHLGAYDPEGDSLRFELVSSLRDIDKKVVENAGLAQFIQVNAWTGEITYTQPEITGFYAFAIKITEYRNKKPIGFVTREFMTRVISAPAFAAQTLTATPVAGIHITPQNQVFISPNQKLTLDIRLQEDLADSSRLEVYSDLFGKTQKFQVVHGLSGNSKTLHLSLEAEASLQRRAPFLVVLRAVSVKEGNANWNTLRYAQERGFWVYIGSDIVNAVRTPGPKQELRLYPNPGGPVIYLELTYFRPGLQLQVYTERGQLVWQQPLLAARTPLLRRHLAAGRYVYTVAPLHAGAPAGATYSGRFILLP